MKGGIIGLIDGEMGQIDNFRKSRIEGEQTLTSGVDIFRNFELEGGETGYYGCAATEKLQETEDVYISDSRISTGGDVQPVGKYTEFIAVPNHFILIESGKGSFAFGLLGREHDVLIDRAKINLSSFYNNLEADTIDLWKLGFQGHGGQAENGVVYGQNVVDDSDIGGLLQKTDKNQIGLEYSKEGDYVKMTATRSGYVEVYQPSNYEPEDFAQYVLNNVIDHSSRDGD